jgi:ribosome-associated heat shock protein Hsp15
MVPQESVRVDRWLCAARVFKSRTVAQRACSLGRVCVNGNVVKSSAPVRVGDEIRTQVPRGPVVLKVTGLAEKRQPSVRARQLYEDCSPPPPPRQQWLPTPLHRKGRPTKADRRALDFMRRR